MCNTFIEKLKRFWHQRPEKAKKGLTLACLESEGTLQSTPMHKFKTVEKFFFLLSISLIWILKFWFSKKATKIWKSPGRIRIVEKLSFVEMKKSNYRNCREISSYLNQFLKIVENGVKPKFQYCMES